MLNNYILVNAANDKSMNDAHMDREEDEINVGYDKQTVNISLTWVGGDTGRTSKSCLLY